MKISLTSGLEKGREDELKSSFLQAKLFRTQLASSLERKIEDTRKKSSKLEFICDGDFPQKMAHSMGYEAGLREVLNLLSNNE